MVLIVNGSYLFPDKQKLKIDTSKIIGELATNKNTREISADSRLFIGHSIMDRIETNVSVPRIRIRLPIVNFDKKIEQVNFELKNFKEIESITFKSFFARLAAERERVYFELLALCAKIQSLFRSLSLLQLVYLVIISCTLFSPQFGGSRNLPVA